MSKENLAEVLKRLGASGPRSNPLHRSYFTGHGLEALVGSDVARLAIPAASQLNATLLDAAAGHVEVSGTPPNESVLLTMGIRIIDGAWQYEAGSQLGRVVQLDPVGDVVFWLVTGTPMNWYNQAFFDGYGNLTVTGAIVADGGIIQSGPIAGNGPGGTARMKTNMARMALGYDFSTGPTNWQSLPFNAVVYDTSGLTGKVPSAFVVPIPGYYTMHTQVTFGGTPGNVVGVRFMLSDQQTSGGGTTELGNGMQTTLHAHQTLYCTPQDAVWVQYLCYSSDMINGAGLGWTFMEIHYVGE